MALCQSTIFLTEPVDASAAVTQTKATGVCPEGTKGACWLSHVKCVWTAVEYGPALSVDKAARP